MPVAEALDRVLEILRTTELYSPQLGTNEEDPHTNDLVGGLMTVSLNAYKRRRFTWIQIIKLLQKGSCAGRFSSIVPYIE